MVFHQKLAISFSYHRPGLLSPATKTMREPSTTVTDTVSWYCAIILLGLILFATVRESSLSDAAVLRRNQLVDKPCDEIYVVKEGETLHTISEKCDDPFIVERNPHIHDPDDVFPGLVIKIITPSNSRKLLRQ
ncbi:uncharacterized protein LOC122304460 [Carya illinoinensis]|nr:uncharacterized protein LOC122304460 [Carya illinoinensis]